MFFSLYNKMSKIMKYVICSLIVVVLIYVMLGARMAMMEGYGGRGGGGGRVGGGRVGGGRVGGGRVGGGRGYGHGYRHGGGGYGHGGGYRRGYGYGGGWGWGLAYPWTYRQDDYPWYYPSFLRAGYCKNGCGNLGNGEIGCVNPGYGYDNCIFASDCTGCIV